MTFGHIALLGMQAALLFSFARTITTVLKNRRYGVIVRGLRLRHFGKAMLIIPLVIGTCGFLILKVPGMRIGWLALLGTKGSILTASTGASSTSEPTAWIVMLVPAVLLTLIFFHLPNLARREEQMFRRGTELQGPGVRWYRQAKFGLMHMIMGIPIGITPGLMLAGGAFMGAYRRAYGVRQSRLDAMLESTRLHLAYNLIIVGICLLTAWLAVGALWVRAHG